MKKILVLIALVAGGVWLSGCSKSQTPNAPTGTNAQATTPAQAGAPAEATSPALAADSPANLKIKWTPGKTLSMRMELNQGIDSKAPNQPDQGTLEVKLTQDFNLSAVKKLDNGGWELALEFENQSMDVSQGGHSLVTFDSAQSSAQETNNPVAPMLRAMIGARLEYFTDATGKVEKMDGLDDLMKRISAVAKPQQIGMFQQMFSEDTLKRYGSFSEALPNRMVNIGESWTTQNDIKSTIGTLGMDVNYTFKDWEQHGDRRCARVQSTGKISTKTASAAMVGAMVNVENGKITGDFWFDPETGMIVDAHDNQDMTLKITTRTLTMTQQLGQKVRLWLVDAQ
jgi:hypothetical protein